MDGLALNRSFGAFPRGRGGAFTHCKTSNERNKDKHRKEARAHQSHQAASPLFQKEKGEANPRTPGVSLADRKPVRYINVQRGEYPGC